MLFLLLQTGKLHRRCLSTFFPDNARMNSIAARLALGLLISAAIGIVAYRRGSLSVSGIAGAILTGTAIFGFGGWIPGILLVLFFVSSSLLSKFKARSREKRAAAELFDKGGQRDIWQALANGGTAAGLAICAAIAELVGLPDAGRACYAGMLGALATVTADTWATELGVLSKSPPRLITTFKPVMPGTSGGISRAGTLAALAGAAFIALAHHALAWAAASVVSGGAPALSTAFGASRLLYAALPAGVIGALSDSLMGATVQAQFFCAARAKPTERAREQDGTSNSQTGGIRWLNNDWVNFLSSLCGAAVAATLMFA